MTTEQQKELIEKNVSVCYSRAKGKFGRRYCYIRPKDGFEDQSRSDNRSRRVGGWDGAELIENIVECVEKWYDPIQYFLIDGRVIGSNSTENALKEYWRICDKDQIKKPQIVEKLNP